MYVSGGAPTSVMIEILLWLWSVMQYSQLVRLTGRAGSTMYVPSLAFRYRLQVLLFELSRIKGNSLCNELSIIKLVHISY